MKPHVRTTHRTLGNGYTATRSCLVPALHPSIRAQEARDRTRRPLTLTRKETRRHERS